MTQEDINRAREICDKATPPPWERSGCAVSLPEIRNTLCETRTWQEAEFIAESRTLLPKALDEIERLTRERDAAVLRADKWESRFDEYITGDIENAEADIEIYQIIKQKAIELEAERDRYKARAEELEYAIFSKAFEVAT